jgi:hypothetical protein
MIHQPTDLEQAFGVAVQIKVDEPKAMFTADSSGGEVLVLIRRDRSLHFEIVRYRRISSEEPEGWYTHSLDKVEPLGWFPLPCYEA